MGWNKAGITWVRVRGMSVSTCILNVRNKTRDIFSKSHTVP